MDMILQIAQTNVFCTCIMKIQVHFVFFSLRLKTFNFAFCVKKQIHQSSEISNYKLRIDSVVFVLEVVASTNILGSTVRTFNRCERENKECSKLLNCMGKCLKYSQR